MSLDLVSACGIEISGLANREKRYFPPTKTPVAQKHRTISRQEKMAFSTPGRVALELPSPSPRVCTDGRTDGRTYADVTTKMFRIDTLPYFLSNGAPLAGFARRLCYQELNVFRGKK